MILQIFSMVMSLVAGFADYELHHIRQMLRQRYKKDVEIELADCGLILDENSKQATRYPTVFWYVQGVNFVVFKLGLLQFRGQFFYTPHDQYGTEIEQYTDLDECVSTLLQTQAKHEREWQGDANNSGELPVFNSQSNQS